MEKFNSNDIITDLSAIMKLNTAFYQSDFDIDKKILMHSAISDHPQDKSLLWLSRPSGTQCHLERDVFMKDTYPFNNWKFFAEQTHDKILAYAVHISGYENKTIRGCLYPLDYPKPNSPAKTHFMTELSVYFTPGSTKDLERSMDKIPFRSLSFSKTKGKEGIQVMVSKEEIREFQKAKKSSIKDLLDAARKEIENQSTKANTRLPDKKKGVER